jgi:DNA polymerase V
LNGRPAIGKVERKDRQIVMVSKSFQSPVYDLEGIITALSLYTQEAVKRIREEGLSCRYVTVYLMTNAFAEGEHYFNQASVQLPRLSAYLPEILTAAKVLLQRLFRTGYKYRKVMIGLTGLTKDTNPQYDLFDNPYNEQLGLEPLMQAFDKINEKYGRGTVKLCSGLAGKTKEAEAFSWEVKREYLSPRYTTNIKEIPLVF